MTRYEFLEKMRHALANDLSGSVVQENVNYYDSYISDEVRKGRSEQEVIEELGDPWAIARTIIESVAGTGNVQEEYAYEPRRQAYGTDRRETGNPVHVFGIQSWWKKLVLVLGLLGVLMIVMVVIGGIFSLLAPIVIPVMVVLIIVRMFGRRR